MKPQKGNIMEEEERRDGIAIIRLKKADPALIERLRKQFPDYKSSK